MMLAPETYEAISVVNRFDLASKTGADCGEYRITFADTGRVNAPNERLPGQLFLIFEAKLPNPNPSQGIEGCRPIAQFWADLTLNNDMQDRAQKLRGFYFNGLNGSNPVVHINNYRGEAVSPASGQIRVTNRINPFDWRFFELNTRVTSNILSVDQVTIKETPFIDLAGDSSLFPTQAAIFQNATIAALGTPGKGLLANSMSALAINLPAITEAGHADGSLQSDKGTILSQFLPPNTFETPTLAAIESGFNEGNSLFARRIQQQLTSVGSTLSPAHVLARLNSQTCVGCHNNSLPLGGGINFITNVNDNNNINLEMHSSHLETIPTTTRIEAESFSQQSGVQTENTSDIGGGRNVGWLDTGDWMVYSVPVPRSFGNRYTIRFRVASNVAGGGELQFEQPGGAFAWISSLIIPNTNGWQNWQTLEVPSVTIPPGETGIALAVKKGGFNINWIEIVAETPVTPERFAVKAPLKNVFLPERKTILETYLNNAPCTTCNVNLVRNGDFGQGQTDWQVYQHAGTNASLTFGGQFVDARASIFNGGTESWHVQFYQTGLNLEQGKTYEVSYKATTASHVTSAQLEVAIEQHGGSYTKYAPVQNLTINPADATFTFQFTMSQPTNPNARITFNLGKNQTSGNGAGSSIFIDSVSIKKIN